MWLVGGYSTPPRKTKTASAANISGNDRRKRWRIFFKRHGPPGNLTGIGATLRLMSGTTLGPAREVHAGSGYWSQDSAVQVLASPEPPTQVRVRWPGGQEVTGAIPAGAREISVDRAGRVLVLH